MSMVLRARIVELKSDAKRARERARKKHEAVSKFGRQKGNRGSRSAQNKMSQLVQNAYNADCHYKAIESKLEEVEARLAAWERQQPPAYTLGGPAQPTGAPLRHSPELVRAVQQDGRQMAVAALAMAYKMTKAEIIRILNMEV